jgi:hypothetical protein
LTITTEEEKNKGKHNIQIKQPKGNHIIIQMERSTWTSMACIEERIQDTKERWGRGIIQTKEEQACSHP